MSQNLHTIISDQKLYPEEMIETTSPFPTYITQMYLLFSIFNPKYFNLPQKLIGNIQHRQNLPKNYTNLHQCCL